MKAYRIIADEPLGFCIGFKPKKIRGFHFEADLMDFEESTGEYAFILYNPTRVKLSNQRSLVVDGREVWSEPDASIWHNQAEFVAELGELAD